MEPEPLLTIGGIVVVIVARRSKLRKLSPNPTQQLLPVFLTLAVVILIVLRVLRIVKSRVEAKQAAALVDLQTALKPALPEVHARVIAAGLGTPRSVDHYTRVLRQPELKALVGQDSGLRRTNFR